MLRGNQKFAGKRELPRTPAERFLGAKEREVGIIIFLRNVRQNEVVGPAIEAFGIGKKLAHGVIRKMAGPRKYTLFDYPGIRPDLEHIEVVVRFQNQAIGGAQVDLHKFGHVAEVGADRDLRAVGAKSESDRVGRIVRNREGMNIDVTDGKTLASLNGFDAAQALAEGFGQDALKLGHCGPGHIQGCFPDTENLGEAVAMVGVFVGDQDGVEVADLSSDRGKPREGFAFSEPGINEDAGAFGFEQRQIARAAGRKNRNAQTDRNCPLPASALSEHRSRLQAQNFKNDGRARRQRQ